MKPTSYVFFSLRKDNCFLLKCKYLLQYFFIASRQSSNDKQKQLLLFLIHHFESLYVLSRVGKGGWREFLVDFNQGWKLSCSHYEIPVHLRTDISTGLTFFHWALNNSSRLAELSIFWLNNYYFYFYDKFYKIS